MASRYCSSADALGLEAHHGVLDALAQLVVDERLGRVLVDQLGEGVGGPLEQRAGAPGPRRTLSSWLALGVAERLDRLERRCSRSTHSSVSSGSTSSCTFFTVTVKSAGSSVPDGRGGELALVVGQRADEVVVEVVGDPAPAELVHPVLGGEPGHRLAVAGGREVERDDVALGGRAVDVGQLAVAGAGRASIRASTSSSATAGFGSSTRRPP